MKQALWIGLLLISMMACRQTPQTQVHGSGGNSNPSNPPNPSNDKLSNVTNTELCKAAAPASQTLYTFWSGDWQQGAVTLHETFRFDNKSILRRITCKVNNETCTVEAHSEAEITDSEIGPLDQADSSRPCGGSQSKAKCSVSINRGDVISYSFEGPCLRIQTGSRDDLLVPGP